MENKIDWKKASKMLQEHGVRNMTTLAEAPLEAPSKMIQDCTPGVEPWVLDNIEACDVSQGKLKFEREYASCIITPGGDDLEGIMVDRLAAMDKSFMAIHNAMYMETMLQFNEQSKSQNIYSLENIYIDNIECKLIETEEISSTPPKGRSQKAHNAIQKMNTRRKR